MKAVGRQDYEMKPEPEPAAPSRRPRGNGTVTTDLEVREMKAGRRSLGTTARVGVVVGLAALAGCGYAKRDDVDAQMAQIRQDMQSADQALEGRVDTRLNDLNGRLTTLEQRAQALERELQTMRSEFSAQIESMKDMLSFNLPVNFDYDAADVRANDQPVLEKFATVVKEYYPNAIVTVEGFADPSGSAAYNLRLGQERADAVKAFLVSQGLSDLTIKTVSYGESRDRQVVPGAQGPGDDGLQNRRVSLVIDYSGDPLAVRPVTN
jgi:peptidoglycan-associated lipoprotein